MAAMWLVMWVYVNADVDEMLYGSGKWMTGLAVKLDEPATMWSTAEWMSGFERLVDEPAE